MELKYKEDTKLICGDIKGVVVKNYKLPGDIGVKWETGFESPYDAEWLDENCAIDYGYDEE